MHEWLSESFVSITAATVENCPIDQKQLELDFSDTYALLKNQSQNGVSSNESIFITGFPCPGDLLFKRRKFMREYMRYKQDILDEAQSLLIGVKQRVFQMDGRPWLISVHIRRSDYLVYKGNKNQTVAPLQYYLNAFQYYRERFGSVAFVIFSDDLIWCKEHFIDPDVYYPYDEAPISVERSYIIDHAAITLCDHHIISDGTFGFTSALLSSGTVVYYAEGLHESFNGCGAGEEFVAISGRGAQRDDETLQDPEPIIE